MINFKIVYTNDILNLIFKFKKLKPCVATLVLSIYDVFAYNTKFAYNLILEV